jgi:hypothetical protein
MKIQNPPYQSLAYYEQRAKQMQAPALAYAMQDVSQTLHVMRERDLRDPYIAKLLAEMDAYSFEMMRRKRIQR